MKKRFPIIFIAILLAGCANSTQYVKFSGETFNQETNAKIYIIRSTSFGSAIKMKIYQNNQLIGKLGPKSYLAWEVDPLAGDISIVSRSENMDMITISPKAGKTYYIKQKIKMGIVFAQTGLEFLKENEAKALLRKLKKPQINYTD